MVFKVAYIEITNKCNLNCQTCYNQSGQNHTYQELACADIEVLVARLISEFDCERILFSGGEPFLHSEIEEILRIPEHYPNVEFGIVTNGTIVNRTIISKLCQVNNISVQVSLDGASESVNCKTRGVGNFSKALVFINAVSQISDRVAIMMTVSKLNHDDIENMYSFAIAHNIRPQFAFIGKSGNATIDWQQKELSTLEKLHAISTIENLNSHYNCDVSIPYCMSKCILATSSEEYSIGVKSDGTIIPCQYLYDSKKYAIGNILFDDISSLKSSLNSIKNLAIQREQTDFNCSECVISGKCHKGCMAQAEYFSQSPLGPDGQCDFRISSALKTVFTKIKR